MAYPSVSFEPRGAATVNIVAGIASAPVRFNDSSAFPAVPSLRVWNAGSEIVFVEFGDENVIATTASSMPIPPGQAPYTFRPGGASYMATVTKANTSQIYATPGYGT